MKLYLVTTLEKIAQVLYYVEMALKFQRLKIWHPEQR